MYIVIMVTCKVVKSVSFIIIDIYIKKSVHKEMRFYGIIIGEYRLNFVYSTNRSMLLILYTLSYSPTIYFL